MQQYLAFRPVAINGFLADSQHHKRKGVWWGMILIGVPVSLLLTSNMGIQLAAIILRFEVFPALIGLLFGAALGLLIASWEDLLETNRIEWITSDVFAQVIINLITPPANTLNPQAVKPVAPADTQYQSPVTKLLLDTTIIAAATAAPDFA